MAIRFVDVDPEVEGAKPAPTRRARLPEPARDTAPEPAAEPRPPEAAAPASEGEPMPDLPHAKPVPKPRGRKKPLSAAGAAKAAVGPPPAPLLDGLLPELQAHAKPAPRPRGRKKAFG